MEIFTLFRGYLLADATIAAALGTRVYPVKVPQKVTYPAATIQRITGIRIGHLHGPASIARPRYQVDVWSLTFQEATTIGAAIRTRLEGKNVILTDTTVSPELNYRVAFDFQDERDLSEPDINEGYYRHSADYFVWHQVNGFAA
jgi:Protein of unknown function (DUF3168).